jgi:hypothetical protein
MAGPEESSAPEDKPGRRWHKGGFRRIQRKSSGFRILSKQEKNMRTHIENVYVGLRVVETRFWGLILRGDDIILNPREFVTSAVAEPEECTAEFVFSEIGGAPA